MYYVLQVAPGMEERTELLIKGRIGDGVYNRCFHPIRHIRKKYQGEWKDFYEKLLPGYVFITSDSAGELYMKLKQVPIFTKMLGKDGELFVALREREEEWLERLINSIDMKKDILKPKKAVELEESSEKRLRDIVEIGLSQIIVDGDLVTVLSGPLKNLESCIRKINLHKRLAEVEVDFMGKKKVVYLGVELVGKKTAGNVN